MPSSNSGTAPDGTTLVTNSQPIFDGLSSITAFGNATRITIVDETPTDPTFGQVIGGFDSSKVASTNVAANWTDALRQFLDPDQCRCIYVEWPEDGQDLRHRRRRLFG